MSAARPGERVIAAADAVQGSPRRGSAGPDEAPGTKMVAMLTNSYHHVRPANEAERCYLESLIRRDLERCHPGETLEDVKRRASFSKEDKGLLRDWMAVAARRAAAERAGMPSALAA